MGKYEPPYTISNKMLELVSSISEKVGKISSHRELEARPHLRKNNRIRSIHSSLKIEANSLSLAEVRDVINGHLVLGDQKKIQEVKNAYAAYEKISEINPQSMSDLKKIHGIMTYRTVEESGLFRKGEEGVFSGDQCIFVAPPPNMVNELMKDLFSWVKNSEGTIIWPFFNTSAYCVSCFSLRICVYTSFCRRKWKNGQIMAYGNAIPLEKCV